MSAKGANIVDVKAPERKVHREQAEDLTSAAQDARIRDIVLMLYEEGRIRGGRLTYS